MPLIRIDIIEGRSTQEIEILKETIHRSMVDTFNVPERDRYQIVTEHKSNMLVAEDTGLNIPRTDKFVMIQMVSRRRTVQQKQDFYREVCKLLKQNCKIDSSDVMVSIVINGDDDWSFGLGRAQFVEGDL